MEYLSNDFWAANDVILYFDYEIRKTKMVASEKLQNQVHVCFCGLLAKRWIVPNDPALNPHDPQFQ